MEFFVFPSIHTNSIFLSLSETVSKSTSMFLYTSLQSQRKYIGIGRFCLIICVDESLPEFDYQSKLSSPLSDYVTVVLKRSCHVFLLILAKSQFSDDGRWGTDIGSTGKCSSVRRWQYAVEILRLSFVWWKHKFCHVSAPAQWIRGLAGNCFHCYFPLFVWYRQEDCCRETNCCVHLWLHDCH